MACYHRLLCSILCLRSLLTISLCLSAVVALLPLSGLAGTLQKLTAPSKMGVTGDKVTLGALLTLDPPEPKLAAQLDAKVLTAAPAPGQTKFVVGAEILWRLESIGVTSKTHSIVVPAEV